jgi:hypothetical protein
VLKTAATVWIELDPNRLLWWCAKEHNKPEQLPLEQVAGKYLRSVDQGLQQSEASSKLRPKSKLAAPA